MRRRSDYFAPRGHDGGHIARLGHPLEGVVTAALTLPPKVEAAARRARMAAEQRSQPAIGHPPAGARSCPTCGLPIPRSQVRCPTCEQLRETADALAFRTRMLASRPDGRALAERMVVAALLLDLDRRPVEQLGTVELIEGALSAEVAVLRFALSRVTRRRAIVTREPFGHLIAPHLRAAAGAVAAPHERRAAEARMGRRLDPPEPPDGIETLRARLSAADPLPGLPVPADRDHLSDTTRHGPPEMAPPTQPHRDRLGASAAETATTRR